MCGVRRETVFGLQCCGQTREPITFFGSNISLTNSHNQKYLIRPAMASLVQIQVYAGHIWDMQDKYRLTYRQRASTRIESRPQRRGVFRHLRRPGYFNSLPGNLATVESSQSQLVFILVPRDLICCAGKDNLRTNLSVSS